MITWNEIGEFIYEIKPLLIIFLFVTSLYLNFKN